MDEIEIIRGDTKTLSFPITNKAEEPININDIDTLILTCRKNPDKNYPILFSKSKEDFRFEDDKYKVDLKAEDTEQLDSNACNSPLYLDIEVTLKSGARKTRIFTLSVIKDVSIHGGDSDGN